MGRSIFIFISSVLLALPLLSLVGELSMVNQLIVTFPFLAALGIPHGAMDHVLFTRRSRGIPLHFIALYLVVVAVNVSLWLLIPQFAFLLFLLISAYHFGQSQFSHLFKTPGSSTAKLLYVLWGVAVITGLIHLNTEEILVISTEHPEFSIFNALFLKGTVKTLFFGSLSMTILAMLLYAFLGILDRSSILMESFVLAVILLSFHVMPLLIGFLLYFIILHSFKVLQEEYTFLMKEGIADTFKGFVKLLLPYTVVSMIGLLLLFALSTSGIIEFSFGYCLLIAISSITLPHVFVMERFYSVLTFHQKNGPLY